MPLYEFKVTLEVEGPLLTHSSVPMLWGIDAPYARDSGASPMIPWTLVKGRLRESWTELCKIGEAGFQPDIDSLLGVPTGSESKISPGAPPHRGTLRGTDFRLEQGEPFDDNVLYRIQVDDERGAAQTGMYQVIESPLAPGKPGRFVATLSLHTPDLAAAGKVKVWLDKGLRWILSVGAFRTVGFGSLLSVTVEGPTAVTSAVHKPGAASRDDLLSFAVQLDRPFEISRSQPNSNLFESEVVIPGGVLKGAVATTWAESLGNGPSTPVGPGFDPARPDLCEALSLIRFTYALPEEADRRAVQVPLSAVFVQTGEGSELRDAALAPGPGLFDGRAPSFRPDWKKAQLDEARKAFGWPELATELRVRTAIEKGVAAEGKLFAYESVIPGDRRWLFEVDLSAITNAGSRSRAAQQLLDLLGGGIRGIGKTKANSRTLDVLPGPALRAATGKPRSDGVVVLTLQTDALLFDARTLTESSDPVHIHALYAEYFREASGGEFLLLRHFARQRLAGGWYLHSRFQAGKPYHPLALTEAGSVFVLRMETSHGWEAVLERWQRRGLPIPESVAKQLERTIDGKTVPGSDWRNCPFVPENGWGEIAVDLAFHEEKRLDIVGRFDCDPRTGPEEVAR